MKSAVVGCILLGGLVTGCGDDEETLSATEFREQSSVIICTGDQEIGAAIGQVFGGGEPTPEDMSEALASIVSSSRRQADAIDALAVPSDMADDVDALLVEWRSAATAAEAQGLGYFESDDDPWVRTAELAENLGLESCDGG